VFFFLGVVFREQTGCVLLGDRNTEDMVTLKGIMMPSFKQIHAANLRTLATNFLFSFFFAGWVCLGYNVSQLHIFSRFVKG
jgi:hypothetical protein